MFIVVLVLYFCIVIYKHAHTKHVHAEHAEHFIDDPNQTQDVYKARLDVMNVFDLNMKRKPTPAEINKYSTFNNEQDILAAVLSDKHSSSIDNATDNTEAEESPKHVPITALSSHKEPAYIVLEETTEKYVDSADINEITISREYADELKKQVERLEGELGKFRKILA